MRLGLLLILTFFSVQLVKAQLSDTLYDRHDQILPGKEFRPSIGGGLGVYTFYGDVTSKNSRSSYAGSMVYSLYASRRVYDFLDLGLKFSTGNLIGNETGPDRYLNFQTIIHSGTAYLGYNFKNLLPKNKMLNPYFTLGVSFFEFNNKGDLYDANGNLYYYWSDGTIRNLDENSNQAAQAVQLQRDYNYETDLRKANLDGLERYTQVGFAIPVGLELEFNVTDRFTFRIGSVYHYSFTDLLDNVSEAGVGNRKGGKANDHFLQNNISVHYDLFANRRKIAPEVFEFPDYFAMDVNDDDKDGVINELDTCPFTLKNVKVDGKGCPLDYDSDGVPDFIDKEKETAPGNNVTKSGIAMTDEDYMLWYMTFIDSLDIPMDVRDRLVAKKQKAAVYRVFLKEMEAGTAISDSMFNVFNEEQDLSAFNVKDNKTVFVVGQYPTQVDAEERRDKLVEKGFKDAEVVVLDEDNMMMADQWKKIAEQQIKSRYKEDFAKVDSMENMPVVKLGTTEAGTPDHVKAKYLKDKEVVPIPGKANSTDYVVGPFTDTIAAQHKVEQYKAQGFDQAQVATVIDGKVEELKKKMQSDENEQLPVLEKMDDFQKLRTLDGKLVVKIGTITSSTSKAESDRLYNDKKAIMVSRPNKTIDFIYPIGYDDEREAQIKKEEYLKNGFINPVIASVLFEEDQLKLIYKELLEDKYTISLGSYKTGVNNKEEEKILSIPDVRSIQTYDPTVHHYTVGVFDSKEQAKARMMELYKQGYSPEIVKYDNGQIIPVDSRGIFNEQELAEIKQQRINPILKTDAVVFRVQVGAFKNKYSENQFRNVAVVSFESEGGLNKYLTDGSSTYRDAYMKKLKMRELGFKDAFVVAHKDGKKIEVKDLVNQQEFAQIKNELGDIPSTQTQPKPSTSAPEAKDIVYKVQLGAYKDMLVQDKFSEFENVEIEVYGEYKRFITGNYTSYAEASKLKEIAKAKGFTNAFVVAYNKGQRMSAPEHNPNVIKTNEGSKNISPDDKLKKLVIMVQIGMYRGALPADVAAKFETIPKLTKQITEQGIIRYMAGEFKDPAEATAYKQELISKGFTDVFLVAFYDSEKIEIKEAIEIYNQSK